MNSGENHPATPDTEGKCGKVKAFGIGANPVGKNAAKENQRARNHLRDFILQADPFFWFALGAGVGFTFAFMLINAPFTTSRQAEGPHHPYQSNQRTLNLYRKCLQPLS